MSGKHCNSFFGASLNAHADDDVDEWRKSKIIYELKKYEFGVRGMMMKKRFYF